ncbi:MAG TPA: YdiU family protein, partial [Pseudonocardia sp.]|nr:YdiU family protein [Pseudonocardia sp.]
MTVVRPLIELDASYARAVPRLSVPWTAASAPDPHLLVLNEGLAAELGVDAAALREPAGVELLVGQGLPDGVATVAQAYAGHQFGMYSPRLGDGRALLLGEVVDAKGRRRDLHLKGSGRTPFARGGDGKAAVGPMLREYLVGEAMHGLGIPTTRALSLVATGEQVQRERALPGAVLCRVAASHLRVGTFQYAAASGDRESLRALADHAIARHHPEAADAAQPYLELYRRVIGAQAELVARWMLVGFVHGVMNTDNMTISGETIDYGPCAFLDAYDPATVFSSIDDQGRYAYGNQAAAAQWNLARLGEALLPLIGDDSEAAVAAATEALTGFADAFTRHWAAGMAAKLGLPAPDQELVNDLLELMRAQRVDFTGFFRALSAGTARTLFAEPEPFDAWAARRDALLPADRAAVAAAMDRVNPVYIPRNHRVEEALTAATKGDLGPFR